MLQRTTHHIANICCAQLWCMTTTFVCFESLTHRQQSRVDDSAPDAYNDTSYHVERWLPDIVASIKEPCSCPVFRASPLLQLPA